VIYASLYVDKSATHMGLSLFGITTLGLFLIKTLLEFF
jgi:hypothetical protein